MDHKKYEEMIADISAEITSLAMELSRTIEAEKPRIQAAIDRLTEEIRKYAKEAARAATEEAKKSNGATVDFWDLGSPKARIYKKPDFDGHSVSTTPVDDENHRFAARFSSEKIPPKSQVSDAPAERRFTSSYRRNAPINRSFSGNYGNNTPKTSKILRSYEPGGVLLHKITVRSWETENEFYGRFISDATSSHKARSKFEPDAYIKPVQYQSYVPQYAHMNSSQVDYYRWLRENIRRGRYPECDLGYLQLYIYEIFNLPGEIPPSEGVALLSSIWLNYRGRHGRLDGYLCEWFADYCLTNGCSLPAELVPILHEIAPKAQFKEFYIDPIVSSAVKEGDEESVISLGKTVIEVSSDYDYRSARYYHENKEAYDTHIPRSVGAAVKSLIEESAEPFSLDRLYKMTRDSFNGAIVAGGIKKRVDIEFSSFTRRADVRDAITALVKYSENKVRVILGIKSKLRLDGLPGTSEAVIDKYFAPHLPTQTTVKKEDEFMPRDYLKLYEAEDSGFDFGKAAEIERLSWVNTERLTGEEYVEKTEEYHPDHEITLAGEVSFDSVEAYEPAIDIPVEKESANTEAASCGIVDALAAALGGKFREYCRANSLYDGEVADRINTVFLDIIGDVVLEDCGNGYQIIEDYREDAENWLQMQ